MRPVDFRFRLDAASFHCVRFASTMVDDHLSLQFRYCVELNASYDGNRQPDEVIFPEDDGKKYDDLSVEEVVDLLCREQRVPQWIDISVAFSSPNQTHLSLTCCGRYHSEDSRLYYYEGGGQPFNIRSPVLPRHYKEGVKFSLPDRTAFFERFHR